MASVLVLPKRSLATGSNIYWRIPFTSSCGAFQVPFNRLCRSQSSCFTVVPKFLIATRAQGQKSMSLRANPVATRLETVYLLLSRVLNIRFRILATRGPAACTLNRIAVCQTYSAMSVFVIRVTYCPHFPHYCTPSPRPPPTPLHRHWPPQRLHR